MHKNISKFYILVIITFGIVGCKPNLNEENVKQNLLNNNSIIISHFEMIALFDEKIHLNEIFYKIKEKEEKLFEQIETGYLLEISSWIEKIRTYSVSFGYNKNNSRNYAKDIAIKTDPISTVVREFILFRDGHNLNLGISAQHCPVGGIYGISGNIAFFMQRIEELKEGKVKFHNNYTKDFLLQLYSNSKSLKENSSNKILYSLDRERDLTLLQKYDAIFCSIESYYQSAKEKKRWISSMEQILWIKF